MAQHCRHPVELGVDRLSTGRDGPSPEQVGNIGMLTNRAARCSDGRWPGDALQRAGYRLTHLFTPEHGLEVAHAAGEPVPHSELGGIPVWSLYGTELGAVDDAFASIDTLLVDLPDVGCRYYTYAWTMREAMQLAARHGKPCWVLDRPNPLGGTAIEGPLPREGFDSPVCAFRVPVRHGLTLAELALWQRQQLELDVDLHVVPIRGWLRSMFWTDTGLSWTPPSPALPTTGAAFVYPGTCLLEGTNLSEGRGTEAPFQLLGAPFLRGSELAARLRTCHECSGARITATTFTPASGKWAGQQCGGIYLEVVDRTRFRPVLAALQLLAVARTLPEFDFRREHFDALAGGPAWRQSLEAEMSPDEIAAGWNRDESWFREARSSVLLYQ